MTPEKLRDLANMIECKGALSAKETAEHYRAHAAALEELATMRPFFIKHALGPKARPSCLCCGRSDYESVAVQHGELPGIVICDRCKSAAAPEENAKLAARVRELERMIEDARNDMDAMRKRHADEMARFGCPFVNSVVSREDGYSIAHAIIDAYPTPDGLRVVIASVARSKP